MGLCRRSRACCARTGVRHLRPWARPSPRGRASLCTGGSRRSLPSTIVCEINSQFNLPPPSPLIPRFCCERSFESYQGVIITATLLFLLPLGRTVQFEPRSMVYQGDLCQRGIMRGGCWSPHSICGFPHIRAAPWTYTGLYSSLGRSADLVWTILVQLSCTRIA